MRACTACCGPSTTLFRLGMPCRVGRTLSPQAYRTQLFKVTVTGLRDRLQAYSNVFSNLQPADRQAVRQALFRQNRIRSLLANNCNCATADQLPAGFCNALLSLSAEAFRLLGILGIRDQQYRTIYNNLRHKVCPFCGLERLDAPGAPRENLDHYLPRSRYPFAAANAKNLVPMGGRCNSAYKGTADLLWNGALRRRAFFPYDHSGVAVSLTNSQPFGGSAGGAHPQWEISFIPDSVEAQTWDSIFHIRERYVRDVLDRTMNHGSNGSRISAKKRGWRQPIMMGSLTL